MEEPDTRAADVVCVLGPPRSGTSLTTRLLGLLGLYLGPDDQVRGGTHVNETGTWEHRDFWEIDRAVMEAVAGWGWELSMPPLPPGWPDAPELNGVKQRARAMVDRKFGAATSWGWKHPVTCLTLPFWQTLLPSMRYVVCLRDPVEVATSMARKWQHSVEHGLYLWLRYTKSAFQHSRHHSTHLVFYEDWFSGDPRHLRALDRFLRGSDAVPSDERVEAARDFIDKDQWHHRAGVTSGPNDRGTEASSRELTQTVRSLYERLKETRCFDVHLADEFDRAAHLVDEQRAERALHLAWMKDLQAAAEDLAAVIPPGESVLLIDDGDLPLSPFGAWRTLPFLEKDGGWWGQPDTSERALQELRRMIDAGVTYAVVAWPAFWWLDHYEEFAQHLTRTYDRILSNPRLVCYDLRERQGSADR